MVVETVAPAFMVMGEEPKLVCQFAVGGVAWSVKVEKEHPGLSVFLIETTYVTAVPGWTSALWPGEAVTLGAERVHGVSSMSTMIVALVLLIDIVVSVTPETGSVKLLP